MLQERLIDFLVGTGNPLIGGAGSRLQARIIVSSYYYGNYLYFIIVYFIINIYFLPSVSKESGNHCIF